VPTTATSNKPTALSEAEWEEIIALPKFREAWGVTDESVEELVSRLYGARFDFVSVARATAVRCTSSTAMPSVASRSW
jgi:hypothetical protein